MYEVYWKLSGKPFPQRIRPDHLYQSLSLQSATRRLRYCVDNNAGMAMLTGLSGVGKSSLLKSLATTSPECHHLVHIVFPLLEPADVLHLVADELASGLRHEQSAVPGDRGDAILRRIQECLRVHNREGRHPILCFDDAHQLSDSAWLQVIQPLSNLSDLNQELQLTILLCGQPVLSAHLRKHAQLSHRVAVSAILHGFTEAETADYLESSLRQMGLSDAVFTDEAITRLFQVTAGNPRRINRLCDMALLVGFADRLSKITAAEIDAVSHELLPTAA